MRKTFFELGMFIAAVFVSMLCPSCACTVVDSGEIGIEFSKWSSNEEDYGGVKGTCKGWVGPYNMFTTDVFTYPIYIQRKNYAVFTVTTRDAAIFKMDSTMVAYRINPERACDIFVKYRKSLPEIEDGYIKTCIYEAYRTCANSYSSDSLMSNRANFESDVRSRFEKSLINEGFIVEEFTSQITPPESLAKIINEKNAARQLNLAA